MEHFFQNINKTKRREKRLGFETCSWHMFTFPHYLQITNTLTFLNSTISCFQFAQFENDLRSGTFRNAVADFLRGAANNHDFGIIWDLDVTMEMVSQEASSDHEESDEEDEDETVRMCPVEE